ncbi:MAG: tetratricopeptide repeat protein [Bacteroidota bacterium]
MRKFILSYLACFLCILHTSAQSADKAMVMDYFQNQQFEEAVNYLTPAIINDSANLQLLGFLAYANYMNENFPAAKKYYQRIFDIDSNYISANQYLASINTNSNPVLAQKFVHRLIILQPNKASYYRNMAELFKKINQKDSALAYYNRAYEIAPADYKSAVGLADILIDKKNFFTADSIMGAALARDSLNISCLKLRIRSAFEAKDYQNTFVPGERLIRLEEISLSALTQLALSYYNVKMYNDCIRVCDFMLRNDLDIESVYYYQAKAYAKIKDFAKSNALLQVCLTKAISKTAEMYYYALGDNYEATNQFTTAVKQYDSAYYLFKNPLMKYYAGHVYENNLKNEKLARKYYLQYLDHAMPVSADEKKAYAYIKSKYATKK